MGKGAVEDAGWTSDDFGEGGGEGTLPCVFFAGCAGAGRSPKGGSPAVVEDGTNEKDDAGPEGASRDVGVGVLGLEGWAVDEGVPPFHGGSAMGDNAVAVVVVVAAAAAFSLSNKEGECPWLGLDEAT